VKDELQTVISAAREEIMQCGSLHDLMLLKSRYTGKKSILNGFMQKLGSLAKEERPAFGKTVNEAKQALVALLEQQEGVIKEAQYAQALASQRLDLTMPGRRRDSGSLHPITKARREIEDIFVSLGFDVAEGFDVED
jgi:phenylalanyl-tRNA synthetase alpha chain